MLRALGLVIGLSFAAVAPAHADVVVLYGDVHGGGMYGSGTGDSEIKDQAFFANVPNLTYGLSVSARFLFLGATISHHQYIGPGGETSDDPMSSGGKLGTWTQITGGLDFALDLGGTKEEKKAGKTSYIEVAGQAGFGVGTGQQIDPPLDNAQIDDKAFLIEARLGYGKHISRFVDFGVLVPVTYGFFFKNGVPANMLENTYQGVHAQALLYLRLRLKLL
jgi:hypothetical protein